MFRTRLTFPVVFSGILTLMAPASSRAQSVATMEPEVATAFEFPLTIHSIMRGPELVGQPPIGVQWTDDSEWIYFRWVPGGEAWDASPALYRIPAEGGEPEKLDDAEAEDLAITYARGALSPDRTLRLSSMAGDLYLVERRNLQVTRLTETADGESAVAFRNDGEAVFFVRADNLFEMTLEEGLVRQLTDIRQGTPPREAQEPTGQKGFLLNQQERLFEHVRRMQAEQEEREAEREAAREGEAEPLYIDRGERVQGLDPTPDGAYVAVTVYKPAEGAQRVLIPDWITESGYTEEMNVRTKVGDLNGSSRIGLLEVATGATTWLDLYPMDDQEGEGGQESRGGASSDPDLSMAGFIGWNDAGTKGLLTSVSYDNKTRWIFSVDRATGDLTLLDTLYDEAWVAGPCSYGCSGWIPESDQVYFVSEATGYAHLYTVAADGTGKRALTSGEWEVLDVVIPEDRGGFILRTNEGSPFNEHVYTMRFDGSRKRAITSGLGSYEATVSPDGERMAVVHSTSNRPPELYVAPFEADTEMDQVTVSPTVEWLTFPWIEPEIIHFTAEDGTRVPARIYRPSELNAQANGGAVIFVHGAGYLHNVHNYWSTYYREYMFNHFLAANGYTVLDIDYRGSAGYGRDWRTAIYRWMGGKDLSDQVDGARYLVRSEGVDPDRIGLYGGSYGGFITLMALFTAPETFKAGGALRSVTDWAHYNHGYTSRILNLPQNDAEAYEKSSPIYFAENFRGYLLMAHGMVDTNVHFSDVVRLSQRLIELGKENWELAVYPVENHGFVEPTSWTDEYRRIFELFERTISAPGCTDNGGFCPVPSGGDSQP
jgi:dipeptidyl aminopeptidase/acylaminoacyl peptidase